MRESSTQVRSGAAVPRAGAGTKPAYASVWRVWLPVPVILVVLDLTFNLWFWQIPKLTGDADWGYQFHLDLHQLYAPKQPGVLRVVAFGSSVSGSFDAHQVESLLDGTGPEMDVHRLMKPGIKPTDYRLFFEADGDRIQPDVAVFAFNLLDFLNPSFERGFRAAVREALPPWAVLTSRYDSIPTWPERFDLAVASVSNVYRYRREAEAALRGHVKAAIQWFRGRPARAGDGILPDGYTEQRFALPVAANGSDGAVVEYFVDPEWIRQRRHVKLVFSTSGRMIAERDEAEPGWKRIVLPVSSGSRAIVEVIADSVWSPRASGTSDDPRLLGVRLRETPLVELRNGHKGPFRYPPFVEGQIFPFLRMGDQLGEAFAARWRTVLEAPDEFGKRFRSYRDSKLRIREEVFRPTGEYAEVQRLVKMLAERGVSVVLVNTPESPWLLRDYENTAYYRSYLQFFEDLTAQYPNVRFYDLREALPPEDFNDWHHVNFVGAIKLGPRYAEMVRTALAERQQRTDRGA